MQKHIDLFCLGSFERSFCIMNVKLIEAFQLYQLRWGCGWVHRLILLLSTGAETFVGWVPPYFLGRAWIGLVSLVSIMFLVKKFVT